MQFNFFWFTSSPILNLIIATVFWFVLAVVCMNVCKRGGDKKPSALAYIGYAIAAFGMGLISVAGTYSFMLAAPLIIVGLVIVAFASRR
jgi:hypothetical protein